MHRVLGERRRGFAGYCTGAIERVVPLAVLVFPLRKLVLCSDLVTPGSLARRLLVATGVWVSGEERGGLPLTGLSLHGASHGRRRLDDLEIVVSGDRLASLELVSSGAQDNDVSHG